MYCLEAASKSSRNRRLPRQDERLIKIWETLSSSSRYMTKTMEIIVFFMFFGGIAEITFKPLFHRAFPGRFLDVPYGRRALKFAIKFVTKCFPSLRSTFWKRFRTNHDKSKEITVQITKTIVNILKPYAFDKKEPQFRPDSEFLKFLRGKAKKKRGRKHWDPGLKFSWKVYFLQIWGVLLKRRIRLLGCTVSKMHLSPAETGGCLAWVIEKD